MGQAKLTFTGVAGKQPFYNVTFDSAGGTEIANQIVRPGGYAVQPVSPTKNGYTFDGWYFDGDRYGFSTTPVMSDVSLKASWL